MPSFPRTINLTEADPDKSCPKCGSEVRWRPDCPGYPDGKGGTVVCPGQICGNANYFQCSNKDCDWWYRDPNNRSDKDKMGIKPSWKTDFDLVAMILGEDGEEETVP